MESEARWLNLDLHADYKNEFEYSQRKQASWDKNRI